MTPEPRVAEEKLRASLALALGSFVVALLFRRIGLGGSSMWHDEILETLMANGSLRQLGSALLFDRAQPPVEPTLTWLLLHAGTGETARRVVNALFSAGAIALAARWVERRFGTKVAALTALFLAASPALVRYAHELRPYALAFLFSFWALDAADRWIARGAVRFPWELVVTGALAGTTHYLAVALWIPVAAAWFEARADGTAEKPFGVATVAIPTLALAPLAGWFALLAAKGGPRQPSPVPDWSFEAFEKRFDDLLLRGHAGQEIVPHATLLFGALAVVGFVLVSRRRGGLAVLAGALAGTVAVETALVAARRFTHFRYDLFALPFFYAAMAVAIVSFAGRIARWNRASGLATAGLLSAAVVATAVTGLVGYAQHGRPDWPAVARAVETLGGDEAEVVATIPWAQISLGYYLNRYDRWPQEPRGIAVAYNERERLEALVGEATGCRLVLEAGYPREADLLDGFRPNRPVAEFPDTDSAHLFRFATGTTATGECFAPEGFAVVPSPGYGRIFPPLG